MEKGPSGPLSLVNVAAVLFLLTVGCSEERKHVNEKPVVPVSGIVHVDGAPQAGVKIEFHAKEQEDSHRVFPRATTDAEGRFHAWSYRKDDGLAAGEYTITFIAHGKAGPFQRERDMPDLLGGKYSDPEKSEFELTVPESGEPIDMGTIELTH